MTFKHRLAPVGALALVLLVTGGARAAETLAIVDGKPITENDLESRQRTKLYEAKKQAMDDFLFDYLVAKEAERMKKSPDDVLKAEIEGRAKRVSESDIKKFYNEYKANSDKSGRKVESLEHLSGPIRQKLEGDNQRARQADYYSDLKRRYKVELTFERPKAEIATGANPPRGPKDAPISIVIFSDFECPFCKRVEPTLDRVMKEYRGKVKFYFRDYPLPFHKEAKPAAYAARCAGEQGKFWQYHDKLFGTQKLDRESLVRYANELSLDKAQFETCLSTEKYKNEVQADMESGAKAGVSGTPAFFINGVLLSGAVPFENFKEIIDEQLVAAGGSKKRSQTVMP